MGANLGIIGAGQLSQMLVQAAAKQGLKIHVYAGSATDPAAREAGVRLTVGSMTGLPELSKFLSEVSICGFESELIDCGAVRRAVSALGASGSAIHFVPDLDVMEKLSEKLEQKRILRNLNISSSPFSEGPLQESELDSWLDSVARKFGNSFVVKWSKFGYDGRGVLFVNDESTLKTAKASCRVALARGVRLYAEATVRFARELAIVGVHSRNGDFACYPLVISEQENGVCRRVKGPAISLGVNARFETLAVQYAEKIAKSIPLYGAFGLELFETPEGDLWVNEIAPRVHNSGHYSQDACVTDQFENHLRALTSQMVGPIEPQPFFAMLNLLSPQGISGKFGGGAAALPSVSAEMKLHWYNKDELFPGRKLGHVNCVARTREELASRITLMERYEKKWVEALK